jgi:hypothetical protein
MATVCGIKLPKKAPKKDPSWSSDEKHIGSEPVWDTARAQEMDSDQFDHFLRKSFTYYNYFYSQKDLKKYVVAWVKEHPKLFTEADVAAYARSADSATPMTLCALIKATTMGMPLRENHRDYVVAKIKTIVTNTLPAEEMKTSPAVKVPYVPTIQERMAEKVAGIIGGIEGEIDLVFANKPTEIKVYDYITAQRLPQVSVSKFAEIIQAKKTELLESKTDKDQLKEGYSHLSKKDFDRIIAYYDSVLSDLTAYSQVKKALKKVRVAKTPTKDKIVSKLKYMVEDKVLKIVSAPAASIIGAQTLFVYNVRTRKMGIYIADSHAGSLGIKGTSIVGFDESKSVCKTLRKPAEQLKEFMSASKVQARKFLDNIKAVDTKMNGRISADVLLLKVV